MFSAGRLLLAFALFLSLIPPLPGALPGRVSIIGRWNGAANDLTLIRCEFRLNGQFEWTQHHASENEPGAILGRYVVREAGAFREIEMFDFSAPELDGVRVVWSVQPAPPSTFRFVNKSPQVSRFGTNAIYMDREAPSTPMLPAPLLVAHYTNAIGSNRLTWTRRRFEGVHLLFENATPGSSNEWQFAACGKTFLPDVASNDVPRKFFGRGDQNGFWEFSERWGENSLLVRYGEIWFARLSNQPAAVYAIHLDAEKNGMARFSFKRFTATVDPESSESPKPLARLSLDGTEYFNVTVESVTPRTVTIVHSRGVAALNPQKLSPEIRAALGIAPPPVPQTARASSSSGGAVRLGKLFSAERFDAAMTASNPWEGFSEYFRGAGLSLKHLVLVILAYYFACCVCFFFICRRAEHRSWFFIWFPGVKWFPLFRAAGMTGFWLGVLVVTFWVNLTYRVTVLMDPSLEKSIIFLGVALVVDLVLAALHLAGYVVWSFRISLILGKPSWFGLLLLCPLTHLAALAWLAFVKTRDSIPAAPPQTGVSYA